MNNVKIEINGSEIDCEVLYTFKSNRSNKNYVMCSEKNAPKLHAFIYYPDDREKGFDKIVDDDDWMEVEESIKSFEEEL